MWLQLALYSDAPLLGVLVGSDNVLYFRIIDLAYLLGRKNDTTFARRYSNYIVLGKDVLPLTQKNPRYTANARLATRDTAYRILCREDLELAEIFSNVLYYNCAYVQGKQTFELSYKSSPRLLLVNTPHENTVKVSQWIRDFMMDVELQQKRATELFREFICSVTPEILPIYDKTMEVTREINRENMDSTREMDETMVATREINRENIEATREMDETMVAFREINRENIEATRKMDETMEVRENQMAGDETDGENIIAAGEDQNDMAGDEIDGKNGIAVYEDQNDMTGDTGENDVDWENLFQLENESAFKGYFNNEQNLCESFAQLPQTIHIKR
ncbi:hypothetical protein TNCV_1420471 [Trichonephila clavipes]|nr:hypothetical protein TNCV_1420471 [Trichonephila clavipes]